MNLTFIIAALLIFGVITSQFTNRFGVPVLLLFLGIGMLAGNDGLKLIPFEDFSTAGALADVALMLIIFDSGYSTKKEDLYRYLGPAMSLATLGVLLTAVVLGCLTFWLTNLDFWQAMLIGMIISSTDAAAVSAILRDNPVQPRIATTLVVESAANDPMAILLTMAALGAMSGQVGSIPEVVLVLIWQLVGGAACGLAVSQLGVRLFNWLRSENTGFYYVLIVGVIMLAYGFAKVIGASGILAVFFGGYWLGNSHFVYKNGIGYFASGLASFANMAMFLMLGLLVHPAQLPRVWLDGVVIALAMIFVARPLATVVCLVPFRYSWREQSFAVWGGLKGSVAIVLATYPALYGFDNELSTRIFNIIFFAVLLSGLLQGLTLSQVSSLLHLKVVRRAKRLHSIEMLSLDRTDTKMLETEIAPQAVVVGKELRQINFPPQTRVTLIIRDEKVITPNGLTKVAADDILFVITTEAEESQIGKLFAENKIDLETPAGADAVTS